MRKVSDLNVNVGRNVKKSSEEESRAGSASQWLSANADMDNVSIY